jgi:hypothetical protein
MENPAWGYTRIQGAFKNLGHHVVRSTVAKVHTAHGISPAPARPWCTLTGSETIRGSGVR